MDKEKLQKRAWYKSKVVIIPAGVIAVALVLGGGDTSNDIVETTTELSTPVTTQADPVAPVMQIQIIEAEKPSEYPTPYYTPVSSNCHPSYSGCLKQNAGDYDCSKGSGNGPNYTGMVQVFGYDEFDLDRDNDGWGCE